MCFKIEDITEMYIHAREHAYEYPRWTVRLRSGEIFEVKQAESIRIREYLALKQYVQDIESEGIGKTG